MKKMTKFLAVAAYWFLWVAGVVTVLSCTSRSEEIYDDTDYKMSRIGLTDYTYQVRAMLDDGRSGDARLADLMRNLPTLTAGEVVGITQDLHTDGWQYNNRSTVIAEYTQDGYACYTRRFTFPLQGRGELYVDVAFRRHLLTGLTEDCGYSVSCGNPQINLYIWLQSNAWSDDWPEASYNKLNVALFYKVGKTDGTASYYYDELHIEGCVIPQDDCGAFYLQCRKWGGYRWHNRENYQFSND